MSLPGSRFRVFRHALLPRFCQQVERPLDCLLRVCPNYSRGRPQKAISEMSPKNQVRSFSFTLLLVAIAALFQTGCNGMSGGSPTGTVTGPTGAAFIVGTDAPLASVTSFSVQLQAVDAIDSTGKSVSLLSGTPTVDFARFNGLQTLLDMNDVPVGTYNSISITLGTGTIGYLDTSGAGAPTIQTMPASFTSSTVSVTLATPLVIAEAAAPVGLNVDFKLGKSIQVDAGGQITGQVTPTFDITSVTTTDPKAHIDEFEAAVVSVDTTAQSFVVQGPHGRQFTVLVNAQTDWDGKLTLSDLTTSSIVEVAGVLDKTTSTLDADEVEILTQTGFTASGQVTYVQPPTGTATSFDLYVRGLLPTTTGLTLGQIATVDLSGTEDFDINWMRNRFSQFLFNPSGLVAGQSISIGGPATGAASASAVTVKRVVLHHWGFNGTVVAGSIKPGKDTFQMQIKGFAGVLVPTPVTVYIGGKTDFRDGWGKMSDITDGATVRVVGLLLKDPLTGNTILLARHVDDGKGI